MGKGADGGTGDNAGFAVNDGPGAAFEKVLGCVLG